MPLSRRALLGIGAAIAGGGSGCLSAATADRRPERATDISSVPPERSSATEPPPTESTSRAVEDDATTATEHAPQLARPTRLIADELRWFALTYPAAIERYRAAMDDGAAGIESLRREEAFDEADVKTVGRLLNAVQGRVADAVGGHFDVPAVIAERNDYHLSVTARFASRGDLDRAREELDRLLEAYLERKSTPFVRSSLSRNPIKNRLFDQICPRPPDAENGDGAPDPWFFAELLHEPSGFRAFLRRGEAWVDWDVLGEAWSGATDRRRAAFAPLETGDRRTEAAWILPRLIDPRDRQSPFRPENRSDPAVLLQRYESPAAAAAAREALRDGPVTVEGTSPFGRADDAVDWERVYFDHPGEPDVGYAFLLRTGEFLLAAAVSEVAWNERVDWAVPLEPTWLWTPRSAESDRRSGGELRP